MAGVIEHLDVVERLQVQSPGRPLHTEFDILPDLDDVGVEILDPEPFCRDRPVVPVDQDPAARPPDHDQRLGESLLDLVNPSFQFVFIDLRLRGQEVVDRDRTPLQRWFDSVEFFQGLDELEDFLRRDMLNLGPDDVGVRHYPDEFVILVDDREFLNAGAEDDAGSIVHAHLGVGDDEVAGHNLFYRCRRMGKQEVPRRYVAYHFLRVVHNRKAVVVRLFYGFDDIPDRPVGVDGDDVVGHVVLDPLLLHHDSVTLPRHELFG